MSNLYSFIKKNIHYMEKLYFYVNTKNINLYLCFIFIIYTLIPNEPLYLDSLNIETINTGDLDNIMTIDNNKIDQVHTSDSSYYLTPVSRLRRRIYWDVIEKDSGKYSSYDQFKQIWNPSFRFRNLLKKEFNDFKKSPLQFIKQEIHLNNIRSKNRLERLNNQHKGTRYIEGYGWITRSELSNLERTGLTVQNSKIILKIFRS